MSIVRSSEPAQFLVENIYLLPHGRALDIAIGNGRNAVYLAMMGFQVEGVDMSPDAVEDALSLVHSKGVGICVRVEDLDRIPYFEEIRMIWSSVSTICSVPSFPN